MNRIYKLSRTLKFCFWIALFATPLLSLKLWFGDNAIDAFPSELQLILNEVHQLTGAKKAMGFLVGLIPDALYMLTFYWIARLFSNFSRGEIFTQASVRSMRNGSLCLLAAQLFFPFYIAIVSLVLTLGNPVGERMITVSIGSYQMEALLISLTVLVISWIWDEARKMHEELEATV